MSKKYSEMDTLYYLDTLTYMAGGRRANFDKVSSNTLGFVKKLEVRPLKQRFHYVMFKKDDKKTQRKMLNGGRVWVENENSQQERIKYETYSIRRNANC